jgi:thymidylate synthase
MEINGTTVNDVWQKAYLALQDNPAARQQQSRTGLTMELMRAMLSIEKPTERWIVRRVPGINPAFALAEVIWIVTGRDDAQFLNHWNAQLPKYAGTDDCYHGTYGHRLRRKFNFDQLERAFLTLNNNPESRQVVLQILDAQSDFPMKDGQPVAQDIPCNTHAYLKVRDGKLEWTCLAPRLCTSSSWNHLTMLSGKGIRCDIA